MEYKKLTLIFILFSVSIFSAQAQSVKLYGTSQNSTNRKVSIIVSSVLPQAENLLIFSAGDTQVGKYRERMDTFSIGKQETTRSSVTLRIPDMEVR